jgi:RNAse (barnase) inhibitor barstar
VKSLAKLVNTGPSGVYRLAALGDTAIVERKVQAAGLRFFHVDCRDVTSKEALLCTLERGLSFPDYFGHNWDALFDCLTDLSFTCGRGCCILLEDLGPFAHAAPRHLETLLEILCDAAQHWAKQSASFYVLVTALPGHGLHLDEIAL